MSEKEAGPTYTLAPLTQEDAERVGRWRRGQAAVGGLRTTRPQTAEEQERWYKEVVCDPTSPHLFWAVVGESYGRMPEGQRVLLSDHVLAGMAGLTFIDRTNGRAEISLITDPERRQQGIGTAALTLALTEAFGNQRLASVYGECYTCNPALGFWERMAERFDAHTTTLPLRKWHGGRYHPSFYFTFMASAVIGTRTHQQENASS